MKWFILFIIFVFGLFMMFKQLVKNTHKEKVQTRSITEQEAQNMVEQEVLPEKVSERMQNSFITPETKAMLEEMSANPLSKLRWSSVEMLYRTGAPNAAGLIKKVLASELNSEMKKNTVAMLNEYKDAESLSLLNTAAHDWDKDVRKEAVRAMAGFANVATIPLLTGIIKADNSQEVKTEAMSALQTVTSALEGKKRFLLTTVKVPVVSTDTAK
ncbi:MAG: HEAT repeat domain-containing protein [Elusimicrobiaceae bacterium]